MTFKIGDSVIVKAGTSDPDFDDFSIEGWQGRIIKITGKKSHPLVEIEWDSITLKQMPEESILRSLDDGCDFTSMILAGNEVELASHRDSETDAQKMRDQLHKKHPYASYEQQEQNIAEILTGPDSSVNKDNLATYLLHLKNKIELPCLLTGSEDFSWEEPYIFGGWDKEEYKALKKTKPSYTDTFELIGLDETVNEDRGIFVNVKRVSDKKTFALPLWDLKVTDKLDRNYQLISDYSFWMTNY